MLKKLNFCFSKKDLVLILFTFCSMVLCSSFPYCSLLMQKQSCSSIYKRNAAMFRLSPHVDRLLFKNKLYCYFISDKCPIHTSTALHTKPQNTLLSAVIMSMTNQRVMIQSSLFSHAGQSEAWNLVPAGWVLLAVETAGWMLVPLHWGRRPVYGSI